MRGQLKPPHIRVRAGRHHRFFNKRPVSTPLTSEDKYRGLWRNSGKIGTNDGGAPDPGAFCAGLALNCAARPGNVDKKGRSRDIKKKMDGKLIAERGETKGREGAGAGGYQSGGQMDSKRWSGALQHARGQSNKWAAVKNQYLLINFPTLLACKSRRNHVCIGTQLLPASSAPSKPKALTGREAGGAGKARPGPNQRKGQVLAAMMVLETRN